MKKAIILAPYFLPRRRVGAWRPFKFAVHLRESGWQPHIITICEANETLTSREAALLADIPIYEIRSPIDFTHQLGRQLEFHQPPNDRTSAYCNKSKSITKSALKWVDRQIPIDSWLPLFKLREKKIFQFVNEVNPEVIWSTGDPWSSHWMGMKLKQKFELPWVADFRDPWTLGDINLKKRSRIARFIDKKNERKVISNASVLTFTSNQTEELYQREYGSAISASATIPNSFASVLFKDEAEQIYSLDGHFLNIIFFGRFRPLSPAAPLIDLMYKLHMQAPFAAAKIRIFSFGALSDNEQHYAQEKGVFKNFVQLNPIPLEDALPVLRQADLLWLSTHPERKNIIPAKLWDYLAARRPILSIAPNPEIDDILHQTGSGRQYDCAEVQGILHLLEQSVEAKINGEPMPLPVAFDETHINRYDSRATTKKLANIFDRLT